jgi:hypothetical protein
MNGSKIERWTITRLPAEQVWPLFCVIALHTLAAAASRSASANTSCGDLPPSSSTTGTWWIAATSCTSRPTSGEPVNERKLMPGCLDSGAPASSPRSVTMFSAPAGKPASTASWPSSRHTRHASSAGFSTVALPIASAGAKVRPNICAG